MEIQRWTEDQIANAHSVCFRWANDPDYSTMLAMHDLAEILKYGDLAKIEEMRAALRELMDYVYRRD